MAEKIEVPQCSSEDKTDSESESAFLEKMELLHKEQSQKVRVEEESSASTSQEITFPDYSSDSYSDGLSFQEFQNLKITSDSASTDDVDKNVASTSVKTKKGKRGKGKKGYKRDLTKQLQTKDKFLDDFNPDTSTRETKKLNKRMEISDDTYCDCLDPNCSGCFFPCETCNSCKCGHECKVGRRWEYHSYEIEGTSLVVKNPRMRKK